jgi:polygalacturonase
MALLPDMHYPVGFGSRVRAIWVGVVLASGVAVGVTETTAAETPAGASKGAAPLAHSAFQPALPEIPARSFPITEHGAVSDGTTDNTRAIQATIDAAHHAGGGFVLIPAGDFLCGPIQLSSKIGLRLEPGATLRMLPMDRYPGGRDDPGDLISGHDLHDVAITGAGTIDGQGSPWWPFAKTKGAKRPRMIALGSCERLLIEGVTLKDSPMFHIAISGKTTSDVTVRGVTIRAPASTDPVNPSHNTDACDVAGRKILIENCDVSVGDDNFTCGGNTHDVLITHCRYGYGHGVSIGSYTRGGVSNITVVDCTFDKTECGIRIKTDRGRGGVVENMRYENLRMTDVGMPILIYGAYMAEKREYRNLNGLTAAIAETYPSAPITPLTPVFRNITFRNITATTTKGRRAGLIWGVPESPATHIVLDHVAITAELPFGIFDADDVQVVNSRITTKEGVNQFVTARAQVTVR